MPQGSTPIPTGLAALLLTATVAAQSHETHKLVAADGVPHDRLGYSVAIGERIAVVGAPQDADQGHDSGAVYLFDPSTGAQLLKLLAADGLTDPPVVRRFLRHLNLPTEPPPIAPARPCPQMTFDFED